MTTQLTEAKAIAIVTEAASDKFDQVLAVIKRPVDYPYSFAYTLMCRRDNSPLGKNHAFMIVQGTVERDGNVSFFGGAYDLNEATAFERMADRLSAHAEHQRLDMQRIEKGATPRYAHHSFVAA